MILIAAADMNNGIGNNNELLYNIPEDKKFFKEKTTGKTVIMGRKTYESLPVRPLPNRRNIIMTSNDKLCFEGSETAHYTQELLELVSETPDNEIFVIGGAEIYRLLEKYCDTAYITRIYRTAPADSFICDFDASEDWECTYMSGIKEFEGISYRFITYKKAPR